MKGLLILATFFPALFSANEMLAQDSVSNLSISFSPAVFMPVSVAAQAGLQVRLKKQAAILIEFAYPTFTPTGTDYEKISYYRTGAEIKWYRKPAKDVKRYYALQLNYLYRRLVDENGGTVHDKEGEFRYDEAKIYSPVYALALKIGQELTLGKRFAVDLFAGAGLRYIANRYEAVNLRITSIVPPTDNLSWLLPDEAWRYNYALTRLHLTAGVRLLLRL